jgi:hypothetical protein
MESSEHQYGRKHARLATQPDDEPARLVGSTDRDRCRSVGLRSGSSVIWAIGLIWMGVACILNARRCGRTHCRYTGPFYLAMIAPVFLLAAGIGSVGFLGWLLLGVLILAGSKIIWWATEHAWGKFSS